MKRPARPVAPSAARAALAAAMEGPDLAAATSQVANAQAAPAVVTLPPSAFSADWKGRPTEPTKIGLRLVSEAANDQARAEATASTQRHYPTLPGDAPEAIEHWNGMAMRGVLAHAVCQPTDATSSWFRAMAPDMIGIAFTERGILRLWQGYSEMRERLSPLLRAAAHDDLLDLSTRLAAPDVMGHLDVGDRRLLARILDDLRDRT